MSLFLVLIIISTKTDSRYPDDFYDRTWYPRSPGRRINTTQSVTPLNSGNFPVPQSVLQTASEALSLSDSIDIKDFGSADQAVFVYMYFVEFRQLATNESREMNIFLGNSLFYGPFNSSFLSQYVVHSLPPGNAGGSTYSVRATSRATLPPIINAIEIFSLRKMTSLPTNQRDGDPLIRLFQDF